MSAYLDASVLVALFSDDPFTARAQSALRRFTPVLVVSDFAKAEFASAISRRVRAKDISRKDGQIAFATLDAWLLRAATQADTISGDIAAGETFLRRLDLNLRTPDAINIAVALRIGALLATFDEKMAMASRKLGLKLITL